MNVTRFVFLKASSLEKGILTLFRQAATKSRGWTRTFALLEYACASRREPEQPVASATVASGRHQAVSRVGEWPQMIPRVARRHGA